jgi:hypothetical protein
MEKRHEQVVAEPMRYVGAILASDLAPQKWPSPSNCFTCWIAIGHDATIHKFPKKPVSRLYWLGLLCTQLRSFNNGLAHPGYSH